MFVCIVLLCLCAGRGGVPEEEAKLADPREDCARYYNWLPRTTTTDTDLMCQCVGSHVSDRSCAVHLQRERVYRHGKTVPPQCASHGGRKEETASRIQVQDETPRRSSEGQRRSHTSTPS